MASHACELAAVADGAGCFVELGVSAVVRVEKIRRVIGRLERRALGVAELATEGIVDLAMADQAVGHLRKIRAGQHGRLLHAAVAGSARVAAIEMPADIARRRQISLRIDRRADHRREIAHSEMLLMIETLEERRPRLSDARFFVASEADRGGREVVIFHTRRRWNGSVAGDAGQPGRQFQMQLMRKRPRVLGRGRARYRDRKGKSHFPL